MDQKLYQRKLNMIKLAKKMVLEYFEDGEIKQPFDFDIDFLGTIDIRGIFNIQKLMWEETPFFYALGELIKQKKIKTWQENKQYYYQINNTITK